MLIWDENKNIKLKLERNVAFEDFADLILNGQYIDILENPSHPRQKVFVIEMNNYIFAVPFIIDQNQNIILKTAYPSRKLFKKYRGGRK